MKLIAEILNEEQSKEFTIEMRAQRNRNPWERRLEIIFMQHPIKNFRNSNTKCFIEAPKMLVYGQNEKWKMIYTLYKTEFDQARREYGTTVHEYHGKEYK